MNFAEIWKKVHHFNDHYAISPRELRFIVDHALTLPSQPIILELGVCHGRTLAAMAAVAQDKGGMAFGIDHFRLEGSALNVRSALHLAGLDYYALFVSDTKDFPWRRSVDFLIVDAGHDANNVKFDIDKYLPFVKPNGMVFFDDYDNPPNPDSPHWAVNYFADAACADWKNLGIVEGVRGWRKP